MIVHELVTNAGKYGSLSVPGGYLDIAWRDHGGPIEFSWREHGGPAVVEPKARRGFGLRLVERETTGVGGKADLKFDPGGVRVDLRFPN